MKTPLLRLQLLALFCLAAVAVVLLVVEARGRSSEIRANIASK